jgi:ADP-glucose pyrophosphorylase
MRGGDPSEELKQAGIDAIGGKDKLSEYLNTVIKSKNSTGKQVPIRITHNGKTYVYSHTRDMSRVYTLDVYEESNPELRVTIYIDYDY